MRHPAERLSIPPQARSPFAAAGWLSPDGVVEAAAPLLVETTRGPDPDGALERLARVLEADPSLGRDALGDPQLGGSLAAVAGASRALSRIAAEQPGVLRAAAGDDGLDLDPLRRSEDPAALRMHVRAALLVVASRDLTGRLTMPEVGRALADIADAATGSALRQAGDGETGVRLAVIAMGKWGGRELNYASDIDVLFVHRPPEGAPDAADRADRIARAFLGILGGDGSGGIVLRVDANLRPEGRSGTLTRTIASYRSYWERWADPWEMQALIKARVAAGDAELGSEFLETAVQFVYPETLSADAIESIRIMKARTEQVAERAAGEEIKRGIGGIRDVEFSVQLLQLVHGRADPDLRNANTLDALAVLHDAEYVRPDDAEALASAYHWLRDVEHRLQLIDLRQTHELPADDFGRSWIAAVMGYRDRPEATALEQFDADLVRRRALVRTIHERLFYRPLLEAFAASPTVRLTAEGAARQLAALGFGDSAGARRAFAELTAGLSRRSRLMQQLLPLMMDWLSDAPDPDLGLEQLRILVTSTRDNTQLVAAMRDNPVAAERLCTLLGTGRLLGRLLDRIPGFLARLGDDRALAAFGERSNLVAEARGHLQARADPEDRTRALRRMVAGRLLWIAARDLAGGADEAWVGRALSDLADAAADAALRLAAEGVPEAPPLAVIAMGKWGGRELNYASDLDALLVYDPGDDDPEAAAAAADRVATSFVGVLRAEGPTPGFVVDLDLRPEGKKGAPARSLESYRTYYERWADTWEFQALLRARAAAGDGDVGRRFVSLVEPFVYRSDFGPDEAREVRRMKVRVEQERIPPGEDARFHMKLGRGGLADVEWTVQLLQLQHGAADAAVRGGGTLGALCSLEEAELLSSGDASVLAEAYRFCARVRNRLYLQAGRPRDSLPADPAEVTRLARSLEYDLHPRTSLREDYRRLTRRSRRVVERVFFGDGE
jgi:glutamate-ammonia-ligase adenylyltransferase